MSKEIEKTIGILTNRNTSKEDIEILLKGARENGIELDSEILYKNLNLYPLSLRVCESKQSNRQWLNS